MKSEELTPATAALVYVEYLIHPHLSIDTIAEEVGATSRQVKQVIAGDTHPYLKRDKLLQTAARIRATLEAAGVDGEVAPALMDDEIRAQAAAKRDDSHDVYRHELWRHEPPIGLKRILSQ